MSAPSRWAALGLEDPAPGNPVAVSELAMALRTLAATCAASGSTLASSGARDWAGQAATAFAVTTEDLPGRLGAVATRYAGFADSLQRYAATLASVQAEARAVLCEAEEATARMRAVRAMDPSGPMPSDVAPPQGSGTSPEDDRYAAMLEDALDAVKQVRVRVANVRRRHEDAVDACRRELGDLGDDGLRDPWSLRLARAVSTWAGRVSMVLGVASVLLCWFPPVSAALAAAAAAVGAVALIADVYLYRQGEKTPTDVALSVIGVASAGVGKVLGVAARGGKVVAVERATAKATAAADHYQAMRVRHRSFPRGTQTLVWVASTPRRGRARMVRLMARRELRAAQRRSPMDHAIRISLTDAGRAVRNVHRPREWALMKGLTEVRHQSRLHGGRGARARILGTTRDLARDFRTSPRQVNGRAGEVYFRIGLGNDTAGAGLGIYTQVRPSADPAASTATRPGKPVRASRRGPSRPAGPSAPSMSGRRRGWW